jgi:Domain of unknown function (DUF4333)
VEEPIVRRKIVAGVVSGLCLLAACSKTGQVQDKVKDLVQSQAGVENAKVSCPGNVKGKKGEAFDCTVKGTLNGEALDATAHIEFTGDNSFVITSLTPNDGSAAPAATS